MTKTFHRFNIMLSVLVYILICAATLHAQDAQQAYKDADYEATVRLLEKQRSESGGCSQLYCDLGNAYYKLGNQGAAVLNFEKALRLDPANSQARNNLKYLENVVQMANESLLGGKNLDPAPADVGFFDNITDYISSRRSNMWAWTALFLFILTLAAVALYLFSRGVSRRKIGFFGSAVCLFMCAMSIWFAVISKRHACAKDSCVLMVTEGQLRLKPDAASDPVATPLASGTVFKVISNAKDGSDDEWTQVYLNSEYSGWLPSTSVAVIEADEVND